MIKELKKEEILGVNFSVVNMQTATQKAVEFLNSSEMHAIVTPNPEIVMIAANDRIFMNILNNASLVLPDGIGIVIASKMQKGKIKDRVGGYDFTMNLFQNAPKNTTYFFFGAKGDTAEIAAKKMTKEYGINVVGCRDGYYKTGEEKQIAQEIAKLNPAVVLVALGAPKQEKWIYEFGKYTNAKILIGVGGSLDVMSGNVKRAPKIFIKLNLEWLYRVIKDPKRLGRTLKLPQFLIKVLKQVHF